MRPKHGLLVLVVLAFVASGCVAGVKELGFFKTPDGIDRYAYQVGSEGQDGPKLVNTLVYKCPAGKECQLEHERSAAGPSLTSDVFRNAAGAAFIAGGAVGAAAVLRPSSTDVTQIGGGGGGATATGGKATGGSATAVSEAEAKASAAAAAVSKSQATGGIGVGIGGGSGGHKGGHGGGHDKD